MIDEWNYFEPRKLLPTLDVMIVACRLNSDKSLDYWQTCSELGLKPLHIPFEGQEDGE